MKKRFYVYYSWKEQMELLSTEEKATMLMNLFSFQENKEPILDTPMLKMCWASMKFLLEKDTIAYNNQVERGRNAGQLNNKAPHGAVQNNTAPYNTIQSNVDNDNVNDKGDDRVMKMEMLDREFIISQFSKGVTTSSLIEQYPHSQSLITDTYIDYDF